MKRILAIAATAICCMGNQAPAKAHNYQVVLEKYAATQYTLACEIHEKNMTPKHAAKLQIMYAQEMGVAEQDWLGNTFVKAEIDRLIETHLCRKGKDGMYLTF